MINFQRFGNVRIHKSLRPEVEAETIQAVQKIATHTKNVITIKPTHQRNNIAKVVARYNKFSLKGLISKLTPQSKRSNLTADISKEGIVQAAKRAADNEHRNIHKGPAPWRSWAGAWLDSSPRH